MWSRWVGGGVGGMGGAGRGGGFGNRGFRIGELVARESVARETGIRKRIRGIAESRNRGFGIDGCALLCARNVRNSANSPPGTRNPAPETPRKPPN